MNETATEPLNVRSVLKTLRRAAAAVGAADATEEALEEVVGALVPHIADVAEVFVLASDGLLHRRALAAGSNRTGDRSPSLDDSGQTRDSDHPAALAVRTRSPALLASSNGGPVVIDPRADAPAVRDDFNLVALPLMREDQALGALCLSRTRGRRYSPADVDVLLDVGERASQMLENNRLRREVRSAQRAKADFLAVVNHELRTPLTAVVGYADLLEAGIPGPVTEKQRRQLVRIKESAWDLLELIDGILGYARYEGERPEINLRKVEPQALLQDALRLVEAAAEEKGLTVRVECEGVLPAFPTDPEKARRVLFHLLSNAVKFTPEGEVRVQIRAEPDWIVYSVSDTGIGIRPEEQGSIFEPFWQGERPETRTAGGAGMGLSLAQKLTEMLSGQIQVDSAVGHGSTFTLRFPRQGPQPAYL